MVPVRQRFFDLLVVKNRRTKVTLCARVEFVLVYLPSTFISNREQRCTNRHSRLSDVCKELSMKCTSSNIAWPSPALILKRCSRVTAICSMSLSTKAGSSTRRRLKRSYKGLALIGSNGLWKRRNSQVASKTVSVSRDCCLLSRTCYCSMSPRIISTLLPWNGLRSFCKVTLLL